MPKTIKVNVEEFVKTVMAVFEDLDADSFAQLGGEVLGGECEYNCLDHTYDFTPNECYCEAFGPMEE